MSPVTIVLLAFAALGAGTVDAIAGGGGLITLPALLAAGLPPLPALATNKGQSVWGSGAALAAFWRAGRVGRKQALFAFPLAFAGSYAGVLAVSRLSNEALRPIVIALLVAAAVLLLVKKPVRDADAPEPHPVSSDSLAARKARWQRRIAAALALAIGAYDGFFGPGTGTFLIVGFVALCGRSLVHASADAKVVNFGSNLAAVTAFSISGLVDWRIALPMAIGQLLGGARVVRMLVLAVSGALIAKLGYDLLA